MTSTSTTDPHERAREGLEHLQAAGRELIAAARAALDVAEGIIEDKETLHSVAAAVGSLGEIVRDAASGLRAYRSPDGADREGPVVERIPVD